MAKLFAIIGVWVLSSFLLKLATALGVGFMTYKGLTYAVDNALALLSSQFSAIPVDILQLFALAGGGEAIGIIGSALITSASLSAARVWVGTIS